MRGRVAGVGTPPPVGRVSSPTQVNEMTRMERNTHSKVRELAEQYAAQGFQVSIDPATATVPFDLGNYSPDLIAQKEDQHLIVEVKDSSDRVSVERYRDLAEEIGRHPGWRFLLVTMNDVESRSFPGSPDELASRSEVTERIARAERLLDSGDSDAAFLLMWSALEAMLRRHAESVALPLERLPSLSVLNHLYSQGELSMTQYDRAMAALRLRNLLAHGSPAPQLGDAARDLRSLIKDLLNEWLQDAGAA
jgi:Holliday junction resolvase